MNHLLESHSFRNNDKVSVCLRKNPMIQYDGTIYSILNKPFQSGINGPMIDYFYVTFDQSVYHTILLRGWNVLYKGNETIIGDIVRGNDGKILKIYTQKDPPTLIQMSEIYAILIWRMAFKISESIYSIQNRDHN
jgi:hypothetical protein